MAILLYQRCDLVGVHAACAGIEDVLVESALAIDVLWRAGLYDVSLLEDIDMVGIDDLADVVGDDDDGAPLLDGIDGRLDLLGGDGVEAGGGFVEEDDGWVLEEHAGYGDALLLAAAELLGIGLESVGQLHDLVVDVCLAGGTDDVVVGGGGAAVLDVVLDGAVEDMVFLEHQSDVVSQPAGVPVGEFDAVEADGAVLGLVELVEQVDDGALAGSAESHEGGNLARFDVHGDLVEGLGAVAVGEVDVPELEVSADGGALGAGGLHFAVGLEDAEESLGIDEASFMSS